MEYNAQDQVLRILRGLGLPATEKDIENPYGGDSRESNEFTVHGARVRVQFIVYGNGGYAAEVSFILPEEGVLADTFLKHCAALENIPKNHRCNYCEGPRWKDYAAELRGYNTEAYSPWNDHYLVVESKNYPDEKLDEAVENCIALASKFFNHLQDLSTLRYWKADDAEVVAKAREILDGAALQETDCDREEKAHHIKDAHSFFKGWFFPFNDSGRGTFDTCWPSSVERAAGAMGIEGSFEYAVALRLLTNPAMIAKARQACRIRKEQVTILY